MVGRNGFARWALVFLVAVCCCGNAQGEKIIDRQETYEESLRQASLIAHVRIAGEVPRAREAKGERVWLAEVVDAAYGANAGQLVLVGQRPESHGKLISFARGESLILLAARDQSGLFQPLPEPFGRWPIDARQQLSDHPLRERLPPSANTGKPADAIAGLWSEVQKLDYRLSVAVNEHDVINYDGTRPLRMTISIDNVGGHGLPLCNHIEFEFLYNSNGSEQLAIERDSLRDCVKVYAQALDRVELLRQLAERQISAEKLDVQPGERARAVYDLTEEPFLVGGMRYQVWAELGGRRSPAVSFELPGTGEAMEFMEKLVELDERDGPFKIVERGESHTMPEVQPTDEAAAIEVALALRLRELDEKKARRGADTTPEIYFFSGANLPMDFRDAAAGSRLIVAEPFHVTNTPHRFALASGEAMFSGKTLWVETVDVAKQTALVRVREGTRHDSSTTAEIPLRLEQGVWRRAGETMLSVN